MNRCITPHGQPRHQRRRRLTPAIILATCMMLPATAAGQSAVVFQSDFGTKDGAVAAMKGVAYSVSPTLALFDLTHEIPPFNIWEAAYRLSQASPYWPEGTVFVSVVDPGVGTDRKSVVLKTKSGHFFVSPDNGTLTLVAETLGISAVREIDEARNRRQDTEQSYTFHGRDVYAYTGARLASGKIAFSQVGPLLEKKVVAIPYSKPAVRDGLVTGGIPILDVNYGNVWTNIPRDIFSGLGINQGEPVQVTITSKGQIVYEGRMAYVNTFGQVPEGQPLVYINSLNRVAVAINQGNFAATYQVGSGAEWKIQMRRAVP